MDIKAYIASGILEQYVLGVVTPEERTEVESLAEKHPEIRAEINAIQASLEAYIMQYEQLPPPALKKKILYRLDQLIEEESSTGESTPAIPVTKTKMGTSSRFQYQSLAIAAMVILAISLGLNAWLYSRWTRTHQQLADATSNNTQLAQDLQNNRIQLTQASEELAVFRNPDNQVVPLKGSEVAPEASVAVYWNRNLNEVYVSVQQLPPPPTGKQYQLWAIVDGKPVDAGLLAAGDPFQRMKQIKQAQAFAISLEKQGGETTAPKGQIYVIGEV